MSERETLYPYRLSDLTRAQLEALVVGHRQEFTASFFERISPEADEAAKCLRDFETLVLRP